MIHAFVEALTFRGLKRAGGLGSVSCSLLPLVLPS